MGSGSKSSKSKDKSFSSKGKIEKYNKDGTETILIVGRPFRIVRRLSEKTLDHDTKSKKSSKVKDVQSYTVLVENTENLPMFARHVVVKRTFFRVDEVLLAHREPEVLSRIRDKGILHVFHSEVTRSDGRLGATVAMEYCLGSLEQRLQRDARMLESEVVQVLLALASVLGYLHSRQPPIAHRNINPSNVLIHSESPGAGVYRLCNFRSAAMEAYHCENHDEVMAAMQDFARHTTPGYRAPEMLDPSSHKRIDEQVDMWALGVLLYFTMYRCLPFTDACWGLARQPKLHYPVESEVWYTGSLRVVLEHLLEPDPEKRWDAFALINFMRLDNDLCRHIGTFCFTQTERPEGWEPQEVKVIDRPVPAKVLPERLRAAAESGKAGDANDAAHANATKLSARPQDLTEADQMTLKAVTSLSADAASTDPEVLAYREKLIREQEEAWQAAESTRKNRDNEEKGGATAGSGEVASLLGPSEKTEASKEPKAPAIEDLFGGLDTQPSQSQKATANDLFGGPSTFAPTSQMPSRGAADDSWKSNLFSAPPPQQSPMGFSMANDDSWSTGAPTSVPMIPTGGSMGQPGLAGWGGSATPGFQPQQPMQQGGWGGVPAPGFPPAQQPQQGTGWYGGAPSAGFQTMQAPQMQMPMQQSAAPGGGSIFHQPQNPEKKDPFASLFS